MPTTTLSQFQSYVWESLPIRKAVLDREVVDDIVLLAVQQWPIEQFSSVEPGSQEEHVVLHAVAWDVRRMIELLYGHDRFVGYWLIGMRVLLPYTLEIMLKWWRKRKDNRAKIILWRRKWVNE